MKRKIIIILILLAIYLVTSPSTSSSIIFQTNAQTEKGTINKTVLSNNNSIPIVSSFEHAWFFINPSENVIEDFVLSADKYTNDMEDNNYLFHNVKITLKIVEISETPPHIFDASLTNIAEYYLLYEISPSLAEEFILKNSYILKQDCLYTITSEEMKLDENVGTEFTWIPHDNPVLNKPVALNYIIWGVSVKIAKNKTKNVLEINNFSNIIRSILLESIFFKLINKYFKNFSNFMSST